ncbi:MAG: ester cyclase [bacterium]
MNTQEENKNLVKRFVEEVKNQRKLDRMENYFATDYVEHNQTVASFGPSIEGYQKFLGHLFTAFPDDVLKLEMILADGDMVSYRATESGSHQDTFLGIPATKKSAVWTEIQFFKIKNGKIVEHWVDVDIYSWFMQLGVIPSNT